MDYLSPNSLQSKVNCDLPRSTIPFLIQLLWHFRLLECFSLAWYFLGNRSRTSMRSLTSAGRTMRCRLGNQKRLRCCRRQCQRSSGPRSGDDPGSSSAGLRPEIASPSPVCARNNPHNLLQAFWFVFENILGVRGPRTLWSSCDLLCTTCFRHFGGKS